MYRSIIKSFVKKKCYKTRKYYNGVCIIKSDITEYMEPNFSPSLIDSSTIIYCHKFVILSQINTYLFNKNIFLS